MLKRICRLEEKKKNQFDTLFVEMSRFQRKGEQRDGVNRLLQMCTPREGQSESQEIKV